MFGNPLAKVNGCSASGAGPGFWFAAFPLQANRSSATFPDQIFAGARQKVPAVGRGPAFILISAPLAGAARLFSKAKFLCLMICRQTRVRLWL
jgi:hypothetical protein